MFYTSYIKCIINSMTENFCNKCGECCKNIEADFEAKVLYWDGKQLLTEEFADMLQKTEKHNIYSCKFLENNLCTNENKPEICSNYPSSPFVNLPENCTCCGYIFMQKEKIKQQIRRLKEEIIHYDAIIVSINDKKEQNRLQKIITAKEKFIEKYKEYGSEDW